MTLIRWFRKNNKKLLAIIGAIVMVLFLLPRSLMNSRNKGPSDQVIGYYLNAEGQKKEITSFTLNRVFQETRALDLLGFNTLMYQQILYGNGGFPELALYQLILADPDKGKQLRAFLYQHLQQSGLFDDKDQLEKTLAQVDRISGLERSKTSMYYFLLTEEASRAGFKTPENLVNNVFQARAKLKSKGYPLPSIGTVSQECRLSEQELGDAVAHYLAVLQYANSVTSTGAVSEPQLKKTIRDQMELDNVEGHYATFAHHTFIKKVTDPTPEQLQKQFETYKDNDPRNVSDENPCGFGYRLPDRVQIQYCRVGVDDAEKTIENQFKQLSIDQQEKTLLKFWEENKQQFQVKLPQEKGKENAKPQYRDPDFDEVVDKVRSLWMYQQAHEKAEQLITRAFNIATKSESKKDISNNAATSADYQAIQKQLTTKELPMTCTTTDYLSLEQIQGDVELANTYLTGNNQQVQSLMEILFNCEPLRKRPPTRLDATPVKLMEDIGPLITYRGANHIRAVYLVRIIGVDAAREPVSLEDDGSAGPFVDSPDTHSKDQNKKDNPLARRVKQDWINYKAYLLAVKEAEEFAEKAKGDWDAALSQINLQLSGDPNRPANAGPVFEDTIDQTRQGIRQWENMMQQQQLTAEIYDMINRKKKFLDKAAELYREADQNQTLPILKQPESLRCAVFKDLQATPPTQQDYLRRKALVAQQLQMQHQQLAALCYFDPDNIAKRNHFERVKREDADKSGTGDESEKSQGQ